MKAGDVIQIAGRQARVLGKGGEFVPPSETFAGWALDGDDAEDTWEWSPGWGGTDIYFWYAEPVDLDKYHPNGAPKFASDGMLLDDQGNRSIFDDVDADGSDEAADTTDAVGGKEGA